MVLNQHIEKFSKHLSKEEVPTTLSFLHRNVTISKYFIEKIHGPAQQATLSFNGHQVRAEGDQRRKHPDAQPAFAAVHEIVDRPHAPAHPFPVLDDEQQAMFRLSIISYYGINYRNLKN